MKKLMKKSQITYSWLKNYSDSTFDRNSKSVFFNLWVVNLSGVCWNSKESHLKCVVVDKKKTNKQQTKAETH